MTSLLGRFTAVTGKCSQGDGHPRPPGLTMHQHFRVVQYLGILSYPEKNSILLEASCCYCWTLPCSVRRWLLKAFDLSSTHNAYYKGTVHGETF